MSRAKREHCPHCGEVFRSGRISCPHCGADAETGWLSPEDQELASVDTNFTHLEDGDYELFLAQEGLGDEEAGRPGPRPRPRPRPPGVPAKVELPVVPLAGFLLLVLFALVKSLLA